MPCFSDIFADRHSHTQNFVCVCVSIYISLFFFSFFFFFCAHKEWTHFKNQTWIHAAQNECLSFCLCTRRKIRWREKSLFALWARGYFIVDDVLRVWNNSIPFARFFCCSYNVSRFEAFLVNVRVYTKKNGYMIIFGPSKNVRYTTHRLFPFALTLLSNIYTL